MKFVYKWLLPLVLMFALLLEGVHYGFYLTNRASDGAVLAGVLLLLTTLGAFISFSTWYIKRVIRENHV